MPNVEEMAHEKQLREERASLRERANQILEAAEREGRDLTAEESANFDKAIDRATSLTEQIQRYEALYRIPGQESQGVSGAARGDFGGDRNNGETPPQEGQGQDSRSFEVEEIPWDYAGRNRVLSDILHNRKSTERENLHARGFYKYAKRQMLTPDEARALSMDVNTEGGYSVAPERFVLSLIKFLDDEVFIRQRATVQTVANAHSLGVPSLDNDPADPDWTSELGTGSEDSTMSFGKREFEPHPLAKRIKVSNRLLRTSQMSMEALVRQRLGYKFRVAQEKGFLTGSGANQPLGVFTASSDGISTSRDISTGNTSTSIQFDGLIEAKYALKAGYWERAAWLFHRDALKQISKLTDDQSQYLWRPSVRVGEPDMLLGRPVMMSEYAPNTFTTGLYVGMLADWSFYWIVDAMSLEIIRLNELYAETNQTGFIGRLESDGMPVLEEAFARVTLA